MASVPRRPASDVISAFEGRLYGNEIAIQNISADVTKLERSLESLSKTLVDKLDRQAAKPTNWFQFIGAAGVVLTVLGGFGAFAWSSISAENQRNAESLRTEIADRNHADEKLSTALDAIVTLQQKRNLAMEADTKKVSDGLADVRVLQAADHATADARWEFTKIEFARYDKEIDTQEASIVKRPEIVAKDITNDARTTAVSTRLNAMQDWIQSIFPPFKVIDEIQAALREIRQQQVVPPIVPVVPPKGQ